VDPLIAIGGAATIAASLLYYGLMARASYNILDPMIVEGIFLPCSAGFLAIMCATGLITWDKFLIFAIVMSAYLVGARVATRGFRRATFRLRLLSVTSGFTTLETRSLLLLTVFVTAVLAVLGLAIGAAGDARQHFQKIFRPLVLFQHGLFLMCLVLLLSRKFSNSRAAAWIAVLALMSIPFSGKSVFLPVLYWLGLRRFVSDRRIGLRTITVSVVVGTIGFGAMAVVGYRATSPAAVLLLLGYRLWLSGDVYVLAYEQGALDAVRAYYHPTFLRYVLHPITDLVGIRGYEYPLGAMLASQVSGTTVLTGPNPQLPVLLDFFFPHSPVVIALVAFMFGFAVLGIRGLGLKLSNSRSRFVALGGLTAAVFAPAAGFLDSEQVLMTLVGILGVMGTGSLLDLFFHRHTVAAPGSPPGQMAHQTG
jgi:hypothetical protein